MSKFKFKICPECGYIHLSKKEKFILKMLPATSGDIAKKFSTSRKQALVELIRLENLGLALKAGYIGRSRRFVKNSKAFELLSKS